MGNPNHRIAGEPLQEGGWSKEKPASDGLCNGLNVCACPPNSYVEILTPKSDGISRWGFWEALKS